MFSNGDKIRTFSNEELAKLVTMIINAGLHVHGEEVGDEYTERILNWMNSEYDEEEILSWLND